MTISTVAKRFDMRWEIIKNMDQHGWEQHFQC
jgi:hypothetical protein